MEERFDSNVVLDIAMEIGVNLLKCGAEISRVEETITYICQSYGAKDIDVFAIPTLIVATLEYDGKTYSSKIKRNLEVSNDLYRIEKFNQLSRDICRNHPSLDEVREKVQNIQNKKDYNLLLLYLGALFSAFGFALFFGGSLRDAICAGIVGIFTFSLTKIKFISKQKMLQVLLCSLGGGLLSVLLYYIKLGENVSYIMIGGVMILIPGIYIGTSIKDVIYGDTLSGSIRLLQAFIVSLTIAAGFSVWIIIFRLDIELKEMHVWYITLIAGLLGTFGFSVIFNVKYNKLIYVCLGGILTTGLYLIGQQFLNFTDYLFIPTLFAAVGISLLCELFARILKTPTICLLLPSIIILVPGASLFFTMSNLLKFNSQELIYHFLNTLMASVAIALGMVVSQFLAQLITTIVKEIKNRKKI